MNQFDPNIPNFMQGDITSMTLLAPAQFPAPALPNRVIDPDQSFDVTVEWEIYGALVPLWLAALGGSWRVEVFAESIGGGPERRIGATSVPANASVACTVNAAKPNCQRWETTISVAAGTLPEGDPGGAATSTSGLYKLAATVFLNASLGAPGFDLVGYYEGPVVQVESLD